MRKGKKDKEGCSPVTGEVAFAFPGAIEESDNNLGQLLSLLGVLDEVVPGAADTLAAAHGAGGEVAKDENQDMVC